MRRFRNEALGDRPVIVVLGAPKLGNYVALQPLLQGLRHKHPGARITYVGSRRTQELERLNPWIDASLPLADLGPEALPALEQWRRALPSNGCHRPVDLVINADGHAPHSATWVRALAPRYAIGAAPIPTGPVPRWRSVTAAGSAATAFESSTAGWPGSTQTSSGWSFPGNRRRLGCRRC